MDIQFQTGQAEAVVTLLDEFRGFDAKGYFTLNHSLLTGMTASFVTYMVILVQFKQSESSTNYECRPNSTCIQWMTIDSVFNHYM